MNPPSSSTPSESDRRLSSSPLNYADYINLDAILNAQKLASVSPGKPEGEHHEMLFVIIHQTYELWFKLVLHELKPVISMMNQNFLGDVESSRCLHHLSRVVEILKVCVAQFDVLETLTPRDFMTFRDYLYPASGFQSYQFRLLENSLGMDPQRRVQYQNSVYHSHLLPKHQQMVIDAEKGPTLLGALEKWLERTPFVQLKTFDFLNSYKAAVERMYDTDAELVGRSFDRSTESGRLAFEAEMARNRENKASFLAMFDEKQHEELIHKGLKNLSFRATQAMLLISIYSDYPQLHVPYQILQRLIDIDSLMSQWRFRHALVVHRMIGTKLGTGGSSGYGYLKSVIEPTRVFKDISNMSTYIIRESFVPPLSQEVIDALSFKFAGNEEKKE